MIPRLIHQTWRARALPAAVRPYPLTWDRWNPGVERRFYTDEDCRAFVTRHFPAYAAAYAGLTRPIQRADVFRYLVVYRFGGLYADVDMECLRPFDRFFELAGAVFSLETGLTRARQRELGYARPVQIANCIFAAEPGHWFVKAVIERALAAEGRAADADADVEDSTGPRMLTRLYFSLPAEDRARLRMLPPIYWMPPTLYPNCWPFNLNMYARHRFWGSWKDAALAKVPLSRRWIERNLLPNPWPRQGFYR